MAHQDYVSRSRSPNKKNSPYKKKSAETPQGGSLKVKIIGLITLIALGLFAYFLWTIKDNQPVKDVQPTQTSPKSATDNANKLPEPPKEKWAYMKELQTKEVEEGEYEVTENGPYQMQCGSFKTQQQAEALKANIAFTGISSQIRKTTGKNGIWYKVILGPYAKKRTAEKDKHKLKNNSINYCQIWLWR
ncbi:SPOR domain-containing protein [Colwelliaceae bacterium 6471]